MKNFFGTLAEKLRIASQTLGDIIYFDGTNWISLAIGSAAQVLTVTGGIPAWETATSGGFGSELSSTPITDTSEVIGATGAMWYGALHTLPTTNDYYVITGVEWKNGLAVAGNIYCGVDIVDADPPVSVSCINIASTGAVAQSGTSAVQRANVLKSAIVGKSTKLAPWILTDSASSRLRRLVVGSENNYKAPSVANTPTINNGIAWTASTTEIYIKFYYKPLT